MKISSFILEKLNLRVLSLTILFISFALMAYLWSDLDRTENSLASKLLDKSNQNANAQLDDYFHEVKSDIQIIRTYLEKDIFSIKDENDIINFAFPILYKSNALEYIGNYDEAGNEIAIYVVDSNAVLIESDTVNKKNIHSTWAYTGDRWTKISSVEIESYIEPKDRPYYAEPMLNGFEGNYWEKPRLFTTNRTGLAVSTTYHDRAGNKMLFALGLIVDDITNFLDDILVSDNGNLFLINENGYFIGLPRGIEFEKNRVHHIDSLDTGIRNGYKQWKENGGNDEFSIIDGRFKTWYSFSTIKIDENYELIVGVEIPEMDLLAQEKGIIEVILNTFIFMLIIISFSVYFYGLARKSNKKLLEKNRLINIQKQLIEERNRDISSSIEYAKRLQLALLPSENVLREKLPRGFDIYFPKDVISGDFYWIAQNENLTFLAVADCTGHGVPGAIVSVICIKALHQAINLEERKRPSEILDRTRELVIAEFSETEIEVNDGMDIALVCFDDERYGEIEFSGAQNSLYFIKKNSQTVEEIKGDHQPIGNYYIHKEFSNHEITLEKGDRIYLTTDGFMDQFGGTLGKKLKRRGFRDMLLSIQHHDIADQEEQVKQFFTKWKGDLEQIDDVCLFGLEL